MKSKIDRYVIYRVTKKRKECGLSQAVLARKMKISVSLLSKIESDAFQAHYSLAHLNLIARILKCSPREFMPARSFSSRQPKI